MVKVNYAGTEATTINWTDKEYAAIQAAKAKKDVPQDTYFASEYVAKVTKVLKQMLLFADI